MPYIMSVRKLLQHAVKPRSGISLVRKGILSWREMLVNMMKVFDTISFVRAFGTKGEIKR